MKKIFFTETYTLLLKYIRRYWRRKNNLLIVELQNRGLVVSLWHFEKCLWQESCLFNDIENEIIFKADSESRNYDFSLVEEKLREFLLQRDVEENIVTIIIPAVFMLHMEQLKMPVLSETELHNAIIWEIEHSMLWETEDYSYVYTSELAVKEKYIKVFIYTLSKKDQLYLEMMSKSLLIKLQGISIETNSANVAERWFSGAKQYFFQEVKCKKRLFLFLEKFLHYLPRITVVILLLSVLTYIGSLVGYYSAENKFSQVKAEIEKNSLWEERIQESKIIEEKINKLEKQSISKKIKHTFLSMEAERLGKLLPFGCRLTLAEWSKGKKQLFIEGQALDMNIANKFFEQLQSSNNYSQVKIIQSQQQQNFIIYKVQLVIKEKK